MPGRTGPLGSLESSCCPEGNVRPPACQLTSHPSTRYPTPFNLSLGEKSRVPPPPTSTRFAVPAVSWYQDVRMPTVPWSPCPRPLQGRNTSRLCHRLPRPLRCPRWVCRARQPATPARATRRVEPRAAALAGRSGLHARDGRRWVTRGRQPLGYRITPHPDLTTSSPGTSPVSSAAKLAPRTFTVETVDGSRAAAM
jgi:hypothetical protein